MGDRDRAARFCAVVLGGLVAVGCGDDDGGATDGGGLADSGPAETTVSSDDGVVTLTVPDDALPFGVSAGDLRITASETPRVRELTVTRAEAMAGDFTEADQVRPVPAYTLEPAGTRFLVPLLATVRIPPGRLDGGASFTLADETSIESLRIAATRPLEAGGYEVDVEIPYFGELGAWSRGAAVTVRHVIPQDGWLYAVLDTFDHLLAFHRSTMPTDRIRLIFPAGAGTMTGPVLMAIEEPATTGTWHVAGWSSQLGVLGPPFVSTPPSSASVDDESMRVGTIACEADGAGPMHVSATSRVPGTVTLVPMRDGLPSGLGESSPAEAHDLHVFRPTVLCGTPPARAPCATMLGTWSAAATFTPATAACGSAMFGDTLQLTIGGDGTATLEQPSTGGLDTGTAGEHDSGACIVEAASTDGREAYHLTCDPVARTCEGVHEHTDAMGCTTTNLVSATLSMP